MDNHSRSNRRPPKGFPLESEPNSIKKSTNLHPLSFFVDDRSRVRHSLISPHATYLIGKAYQEPGGTDLIEEMLMQRDYIID